MKVAILIQYFPKNLVYKDNFYYFISQFDNEKADLYVASNEVISLDDSEAYFLLTNNKNFDYGAYSKLLSEFKQIFTNYEYIFFINSSVRGPFYKSVKKDWINHVLSFFNEETGIVGSSINIPNNSSSHSIKFYADYNFSKPYSHVQTPFFILPREILNKLNNMKFFNSDISWSKNQTIHNYEVLMSQLIKKMGYNLKSFNDIYNSIDYRLKHNDINTSSRNGDSLYKGAYFGRTYLPEELIFLKTNRNMYSYIRLYYISRKYNNNVNSYYRRNRLLVLLQYSLMDIKGLMVELSIIIKRFIKSLIKDYN